MAEGKKSFVLYCDQINLFEKLSNDQAGQLIKHIFRYTNDQNPETPDLLIEIAFEPIKLQLKRDLIKWKGERVERVKAGHLGGIKSGEVRKQKKANEASALKTKQTEANEAVTVNVTVNDTVTDKENIITIPPPKTESVVYTKSVEFWLKEFRTGWTFSALHGKSLKSLIGKIKKVIADQKKLPTDELILNTFKHLCRSLPEWYQDKDLPVINSKFNEIVTQIKNGKSTNPNHSIFRKAD